MNIYYAYILYTNNYLYQLDGILTDTYFVRCKIRKIRMIFLQIYFITSFLRAQRIL